MIRATVRFFPVPKMIESLNIGRKAPETPLSVIKNELETERKLVGAAVVSKRLKEERAVLDFLEQQQLEYKEQIQRSSDELIKNTSLPPQNFHTWWQQQQNIISCYKPENHEMLVESIDWLRARQVLVAQNLFPDISMKL